VRLLIRALEPVRDRLRISPPEHASGTRMIVGFSGAEASPQVSLKRQERAWTSPIWHSP